MNSGDEEVKPSEMDSEDLPNVRAFEDEFTRGFLQSIEETRDGYYPFLSGTGKYEMDFPENMIINDKSYNKENERFESVTLYNEENIGGKNSLVNINYYSFSYDDLTSMEQLESRLGMDLDFKEIPMDTHELYIAPFEYDDGIFGYAGILMQGNSGEQVHIVYDTECINDSDFCEEIKNEEKDIIVDWIKSINFVKIENESE